MLEKLRDVVGSREIIVVDTNVLIQDPFFFEKSAGKFIVIPFVVITELDKLKYSGGEKGKNARTASSLLDKYRKQGDLKKGVSTSNDSILCYSAEMLDTKNSQGIALSSDSDEKIIKVANYFFTNFPKNDVKLLSYDVNVKIQASGIGIPVEDYDLSNNHELLNDIVYGELPFVTYVDTDDKALVSLFYEAQRQRQKIPFLELKNVLGVEEVYPNQCFVLKEGNSLLPLVYNYSDHSLVPVVYKASTVKNGVFYPRNVEQALAVHFLLDPDCDIVSIGGGPGTGKNYISLYAGFEQLLKKKSMIDKESFHTFYEQLLVYRPNIEIGEPIGFLPGDIVDKFSPFTRPVEDNLRMIAKLPKSFLSEYKEDRRILETLIAQGFLSIEPINYIQGRTINGSYILVDEFQNIKPEETEIIVTRPGVGSKLVVNGDLFQVYNNKLDIRHNGFSYFVKTMAGTPNFAHVTLRDVERSVIAKMYMEAKQRRSMINP